MLHPLLSPLPPASGSAFTAATRSFSLLLFYCLLPSLPSFPPCRPILDAFESACRSIQTRCHCPFDSLLRRCLFPRHIPLHARTSSTITTTTTKTTIQSTQPHAVIPVTTAWAAVIACLARYMEVVPASFYFTATARVYARPDSFQDATTCFDSQ